MSRIEHFVDNIAVTIFFMAVTAPFGMVAAILFIVAMLRQRDAAKHVPWAFHLIPFFICCLILIIATAFSVRFREDWTLTTVHRVALYVAWILYGMVFVWGAALIHVCKKARFLAVTQTILWAYVALCVMGACNNAIRGILLP